MEKASTIERGDLVDAIERSRRDGMSNRLAQRLTQAAESVSDEFLARLNLATSIGGGRTYRERPDGTPAVPPPGVPLQITCEDGPRDLVRCRDVAGATDIPLRAPVYALEPTADWVPFDARAQDGKGWEEIEAFFGRELSEDESLVFVLLLFSDETTASEWAEAERALERAGLLE